MRIDFRDRSTLVDFVPGSRVVRRDTGEQIRYCFLADDKTGEFGSFVTKEVDGTAVFQFESGRWSNEPRWESDAQPGDTELKRVFGKAPLLILKG